MIEFGAGPLRLPVLWKRAIIPYYERKRVPFKNKANIHFQMF
ncbi:hypothetical protein BSM4216_2971 [Bacillus smithii]|nr:hypothetical protein BSM4216_2971 [Bacillus smithii]